MSLRVYGKYRADGKVAVLILGHRCGYARQLGRRNHVVDAKLKSVAADRYGDNSAANGKRTLSVLVGGNVGLTAVVVGAVFVVNGRDGRYGHRAVRKEQQRGRCRVRIGANVGVLCLNVKPCEKFAIQLYVVRRERSLRAVDLEND